MPLHAGGVESDIDQLVRAWRGQHGDDATIAHLMVLRDWLNDYFRAHITALESTLALAKLFETARCVR